MKNILFYKPNNHLSFYFISRFLYDTKKSEKEVKIYIVLEDNLKKKISDVWKENIELYDLNHYYLESYKNLILINENDLNEEEVMENVEKNIDIIFYILDENVDVQSEVLDKLYMKDLKILNKINKTTYYGVPNYYYKENSNLNTYYVKTIKKYINKNKKNKIFYMNDYLGEYKRGIINKNSNIQYFFNYIKEVYLQKRYNELFDYLYLDDLESLYELFVFIYENKIKIKKKEFIFNNSGKINLYDESFMNTLQINDLTHSYQNLNKYLKNYHESLYLMHKNKKIQKINYNQDIHILYYLLKNDYHSNEKLLISPSLNILSGIAAFISLNIIFVLSILIILYLIYFRKAYNKYIILTIGIILLKSPLLIKKTSEFLKDILSSLFKYFSGKVIFDKESDIEKDKKYIYVWNPHHYVPLGSFLSIISDDFNNVMKDKNKLVNVCHEFLAYFPYVSQFLDIFNFKACSKYNIQNELNKNNSIGIWLGGRTEMFHVKENMDILLINKRKGLFEMSIKNQTPIIPTFTFGDNQNYLSELIEVNLYILKHPFVVPSLKGLYDEFIKIINIFRKKPEYLTIIGNPINPPIIKENEEISEKMIDEYREKYIKELKRIYEKYKNMRYSYPKKLNII